NFSLGLYGQDIDPLAVALCKINGAFYAPWLAFPLPPAIVGPDRARPSAPLPPPEWEDSSTVSRVHERTQRLLFPSWRKKAKPGPSASRLGSWPQVAPLAPTRWIWPRTKHAPSIPNRSTTKPRPSPSKGSMHWVNASPAPVGVRLRSG